MLQKNNKLQKSLFVGQKFAFGKFIFPTSGSKAFKPARGHLKPEMRTAASFQTLVRSRSAVIFEFLNLNFNFQF